MSFFVNFVYYNKQKTVDKGFQIIYRGQIVAWEILQEIKKWIIVGKFTG
jgi:hypothetical protein